MVRWIGLVLMTPKTNDNQKEIINRVERELITTGCSIKKVKKYWAIKP